ncbi:PCI domain-containing protein 2-like isoform X2 [Polyodon spathula]|nr:PCI domain-containing protein 2-like isoform X2 [Polyodon spathula]
MMYSVALDLRIFANNAKQQLSRKGKGKVGDMLEKAAEQLMSCFRICASDKAIDSSNLKDEYSMAQRVTYKYYVGRKAMFDSDFKQAEEYLSFSFQHCHRSSRKNKRMILIYLLPVKMLLASRKDETIQVKEICCS